MKTVILTGASSGLCLNTAKYLCAKGYHGIDSKLWQKEIDAQTSAVQFGRTTSLVTSELR